MLTWILYAAVACILLAVVLHFVLPKGGKVPAVVVGTLGGFMAGAVLGILGAVYYGETMQREIYGDMYKGEPMPARGTPGASTPPASSANASPKSEEPPAKKSEGSGGGRGSAPTSLPENYPAPSDTSNKAGSAAAPKN